MKLYVAGDSGPSGFGTATRELVKQFHGHPEIQLTFRTHQWGLNREGMHFENRSFADQRWAERLLREDTINDDYVISDPRTLSDRDTDLMDDLGTNESIGSEDCMIREFEGPEDVWLAVGGMSFAEQAPEDDDIYTIISTDYNLDIVPRDWEWFMEQVDEVWVPSEWTKQAIENRLGPRRDVIAMPYGVPMDYEPTEYDCEICRHNSGQGGTPPQIDCLRDGQFNFLAISRFYHIKGLYRLVKAFVEEFRSHDDVRLFIKTTSNQQFAFNPGSLPQYVVQRDLGYTYDPPDIGIAVTSMEEQYLHDLLGHVDAFAQTSRAECFGIAQFQAAYCRTPVVYTDWSAQAELIDGDNGFFGVSEYAVETVGQESPAFVYDPHNGYPPEAQWAVPSVGAIQDRLRELYEMDDADLEAAGEAAREYVKENFRWEERIQPRIDRLMEAAA
jgi:glycosyltransferase involved in cell wall biosynthesis